MKFLKFLSVALTLFLITSCADPCKDVSCSDNGACDEGTCLCEAGYEGTSCETESRAKFLGEWTTIDWTCDGGSPETYTQVFGAGASANLITIVDPAFPIIVISGEVSGNNFTIPSQEIAFLGTSITLSGSGSISNGIITMTILNATDGSNCSGTLTM